ncbi:4'-phosphopantetheinyl transferase family protein [Streptacidiphilus rugosus]|uniref:4'-phosphopantetheinyl transferase family protein n=1 Tax=Streptacidiphilus rugosus TaxID=405783 RepID=UPI00068A97DF|nr:4'-phosphopantetheinyl transferase superfamily protein [Streptacidiphilus rugosus]
MTAVGHVDVWYLRLDVHPDRERTLAALLDARELRRATRLRAPDERRRLVAAHGLTRLLLARRTGTDPRTLSWSLGVHGKPGPVGDPDRPVHWNLSHTGDRALLAVSGEGPVGVDIQSVPPDTPVLALARRFLPPSEYACLAALGRDADRRTGYYRALCRREAGVKAHGGRLLDALGPARPPDGGVCGVGGSLRDLPAPAGCVAALATVAGPARVRHRMRPPTSGPPSFAPPPSAPQPFAPPSFVPTASKGTA